MARSDMTVGRMIAHAQAAPARPTESASPAAQPLSRRETLVRRMLEYVLAHPRARARFAATVAGTSGDVRDARTTDRAGAIGADLVAEIVDETAAGAPELLAILVRIDTPVEPATIAERLAELPDTPGSRLVVLVPRGAKPTDLPEDPRLVVTTWSRMARRMASKDTQRADLWAAIADAAEADTSRPALPPVSPRLLLDEDLTSRFCELLGAMRLVGDELFDRPVRFSTALARGARLQVGATGSLLGAEFGPVERSTPIWLVGSRPARALSLGIGGLRSDDDRERAAARLRAIAAGGQWRSDPDHRPAIGDLIGRGAASDIEDARALLWEVLDPRRLAEAGFPLVPRAQPELTRDRLAVRVSYPEARGAGTFLVGIGGSKKWKTLLPRVTREYDDKTYIVQVKKRDTAEDLIAAVHDALRSLATKA
ncbi:hypothetical protein [Brachybacterium huguangmaarense]